MKGIHVLGNFASISTPLTMATIGKISKNLALGKDEIWYSKKESQNISYPADGHDNCLAVEEESFWFNHRNKCIIAAIKSFPPENNEMIFDIGGGNGFVARGLDRAGFNVALVEPGKTGALNAKQRGLNNIICATTDTAQFKSNSIPAIGLFDVIEHIQDDSAFLRSLKKIVKQNGCLYITVPAHPCLWSEEDNLAGHCRRYTRESICQIVEEAGFKTVFSSYIFRFLPIPIALFRVLPYRILPFRFRQPTKKSNIKKNKRDHATQGTIIQKFLDIALNSEIKKIQKHKEMALGGSCLIIAQNR